MFLLTSFIISAPLVRGIRGFSGLYRSPRRLKSDRNDAAGWWDAMWCRLPDWVTCIFHFYCKNDLSLLLKIYWKGPDATMPTICHSTGVGLICGKVRRWKNKGRGGKSRESWEMEENWNYWCHIVVNAEAETIYETGSSHYIFLFDFFIRQNMSMQNEVRDCEFS